MRKVILATAVLAMSGAMSGPALAADNGIYVGASVGKANLEIDNLAGFSGVDFKGDDTGYKFIVGLRPLDWLAVEGSYVNFGEPSDNVLGTNVRARGDGISAFAVGFMPVGPLDLFAKAGLISWDSKVSGFNEDGTDFAYGVGAQLRFLSLSVRAEYEKFDAEGADKLDMFSIGLTYTFL